MPHLSPMSWILAAFTFYIILSMFISMIWWHQLPSFPELKVSSSSKTHSWNWS